MTFHLGIKDFAVFQTDRARVVSGVQVRKREAKPAASRAEGSRRPLPGAGARCGPAAAGAWLPVGLAVLVPSELTSALGCGERCVGQRPTVGIVSGPRHWPQHGWPRAQGESCGGNRGPGSTGPLMGPLATILHPQHIASLLAAPGNQGPRRVHLCSSHGSADSDQTVSRPPARSVRGPGCSRVPARRPSPCRRAPAFGLHLAWPLPFPLGSCWAHVVHSLLAARRPGTPHKPSGERRRPSRANRQLPSLICHARLPRRKSPLERTKPLSSSMGQVSN